MRSYLSLITLGILLGACSSASDDGGDGTAAGGSTGINLGQGGSGSGSGATSGQTGGPLSETVVEQLRTSSCAGWSAEPESLPAVLEFVVDTSLSMNDQTPATQGQSKWKVTQAALKEAIAGLPADTAVGVLFFPNRRTMASQQPLDVSACVNTSAMIPIGALGPQNSSQRSAIDNALSKASPNGSTPTHDAYDYALTQGLQKTTASGKRFMVLITDGAPTLAQHCVGQGTPQYGSPTQPIIDEIKQAHDQDGVRTFLIGSPGSEISANGADARPWLSKAAAVGGTAKSSCSDAGPNFCHMDLTQSTDFGADLRAGLSSISGQVISCAYELPAPPTGQTLDASNVNVIYTPGGGSATLIGRSTAKDCKDGWVLNGNQLTLCSDTCASVKADNAAKLELLFGCAAIEVPVR